MDGSHYVRYVLIITVVKSQTEGPIKKRLRGVREDKNDFGKSYCPHLIYLLKSLLTRPLIFSDYLSLVHRLEYISTIKKGLSHILLI